MENEEVLFPDISQDDCFDPKIGRYLPDLLAILDHHNINYETSISDDEGNESLTIDYPTQKGTIRLYIFTVDEVKMLLQSNFHNCKLLQNYPGIYNTQDKYIECLVKLPSSSFISRSFTSHFSNFRLTNPSDEGVEIEISNISKELAALTTNFGNKLSFKIKGLNITDSNSETILEKYSNSLFFQFEVINEKPLALARRRPTPTRTKREAPTEPKFPDIEIEKGPMALYWHARDAAQLPMFQFLAYYQSVEYFFPRLARQAAHKKVQSLLKNPSFRATNDADIEKIFNTIKLTNTGRLGDEKSQLHAVLEECVLREEILDFIQSDENRKSHFTEHRKKTTSSVKITLNDPKGIIGTTAARIYDIRCKVVHTKNEDFDSQVEMLLPNSPESYLLKHDIELMRFIAQKVLVHTSTRLH